MNLRRLSHKRSIKFPVVKTKQFNRNLSLFQIDQINQIKVSLHQKRSESKRINETVTDLWWWAGRSAGAEIIWELKRWSWEKDRLLWLTHIHMQMHTHAHTHSWSGPLWMNHYQQPIRGFFFPESGEDEEGGGFLVIAPPPVSNNSIMITSNDLISTFMADLKLRQTIIYIDPG